LSRNTTLEREKSQPVNHRSGEKGLYNVRVGKERETASLTVFRFQKRSCEPPTKEKGGVHLLLETTLGEGDQCLAFHVAGRVCQREKGLRRCAKKEGKNTLKPALINQRKGDRAGKKRVGRFFGREKKIGAVTPDKEVAVLGSRGGERESSREKRGNPA